MQVLPLWLLSSRNSSIYGKIQKILNLIQIHQFNYTFYYSLQRMDLGECPKIHDLALRADYQAAANGRDYFYDVEVCNMKMLLRKCMDISTQIFFFIGHRSSKCVYSRLRPTHRTCQKEVGRDPGRTFSRGQF